MFCLSKPIAFLPFSSSLLQLPTLGRKTSHTLIIYLILVTEALVKCDNLSAQAPGVKKVFKTECISGLPQTLQVESPTLTAINLFYWAEFEKS